MLPKPAKVGAKKHSRPASVASISLPAQTPKPLAKPELVDLYPSLVGPLVDLFGRLRAFRERCRALHVTDPGGLPHVVDPELVARRLDGFTRDVPSLLDSVRLPDFTSGRELTARENPNSFAASFRGEHGVSASASRSRMV